MSGTDVSGKAKGSAPPQQLYLDVLLCITVLTLLEENVNYKVGRGVYLVQRAF